MRSTHALRGYRQWPELERDFLFQRWIACCWVSALVLKSRLPFGFFVQLLRQRDECASRRTRDRSRQDVASEHTNTRRGLLARGHNVSLCRCSFCIPTLRWYGRSRG